MFDTHALDIYNADQMRVARAEHLNLFRNLGTYPTKSQQRGTRWIDH